MGNKKDESKIITWLREQDAAKHLAMSVWTLRTWRREGRIVTKRGTEATPPFHRRGGSIFYRLDELDDWVMQGEGAY